MQSKVIARRAFAARRNAPAKSFSSSVFTAIFRMLLCPCLFFRVIVTLEVKSRRVVGTDGGE